MQKKKKTNTQNAVETIYCSNQSKLVNNHLSPLATTQNALETYSNQEQLVTNHQNTLVTSLNAIATTQNAIEII